MNRRQFLGATATTLAVSATPAFAHRKYEVPEEYMPELVGLSVDLPPNEIHVEPDEFALYLVMPSGQTAIRYTVGVGRGRLYHSGVYTVGNKVEWPSWKPTRQMIARNPKQYTKYADGVPGGPENPLGARALYLYNAGGYDTALRIHGTPQPWTIATAVSNGCARLVNEHAIQLYDQVEMGARVVLHEKGRLKNGGRGDLTAIPDRSVHS
jgi:lipoprotein-anchoring transpeptidase ErfK/SrfK